LGTLGRSQERPFFYASTVTGPIHFSTHSSHKAADVPSPRHSLSATSGSLPWQTEHSKRGGLSARPQEIAGMSGLNRSRGSLVEGTSQSSDQFGGNPARHRRPAQVEAAGLRHYARRDDRKDEGEAQ